MLVPTLPLSPSVPIVVASMYRQTAFVGPELLQLPIFYSVRTMGWRLSPSWKHNGYRSNIVQLNMGRSAAVNDELLRHCQANLVDIALVQEPYTRRSRLVGLDAAPVRVVLSPGENRPGTELLSHGLGIIIFNPNLLIMARPDLASSVVSVDAG